MSCFKIFPTLLFLVALSPSIVTAQVINIDIQGGGGPLDKTDAAAAPDPSAPPFWNIVGLAGGALTNSDGTASGATLNAITGANGAFRQQNLGAENLLYDYAFAGGSGTISTSVSGLSAGTYDVYVYGSLQFQEPMTGFGGAGDNTVTVNGVSQELNYPGLANGGSSTTFVEGENFVLFSGVVIGAGDVLDISSTNDLTFREVTLSGFQIVNVGGGGTPVLKGDVDMSGAVDFGDIPAFIAVLQSGGFQDEADTDCSTVVDFADIPAFITILQGG